MAIKESLLLKLLKDEIDTHEKERGYRKAVTIDKATLMGVILEFESMDNFIKANDVYCRENRVQHAIKGLIADKGRNLNKSIIYEKVLTMLIEELRF